MDSGNKKELSPREVCRSFIRTDRLHRCAVERSVSELGIHRSQHFLLMRIAKCGGRVSQKRLSEELMVSGAAVAVTLKKLEAGGYIERVRGESDGRCNDVTLTDKGRAVIDESETRFLAIDEKMCEGISEAELAAFAACLEKMQANLLPEEEKQ